VPDPLSEHDELAAALRLVASEAEAFLGGIDTARVRPTGRADQPGGSLPAAGTGTLAALSELIGASVDQATRSAGPRFFHFVIGGGTPAALAADWLASALDQNAFNWVSSPFASRLEQVSLDWLKELFGLPSAWGAVMTTGATMANFTGLAAARRWWGALHGVDVEAEGLSGLPPLMVLTSGYVHVSAIKAVAMLGIGRHRLMKFSTDAVGRVDLAALAGALKELKGEPAVVIVNAGEVNAGDFDPLREMVALAHEHNAWVHVDGAFGLFAALSPTTQPLVDGLELADSVIVDGHKWLNVPYDSGFAFVRDPALLAGVFSASAAYLGSEALERPVFGNLGPEMSRRARALSVWATLRAYGRDGYRAMAERHLRLARRVGKEVDDSPDMERLAEVKLNVICFRYHPSGASEQELNELNRRIGELVLEDGRVYFGTTDYGGKVAFRPAIVNWRTRDEDVDLIVPLVRELGVRAAALARPV
jgi:glutamate/tyrosine decarboxylase-like PLP-dependent enzyme